MVGAQANTIVVDDRRWGHGMIMIDAEAITENAIAVEYCKGNSKGGRRMNQELHVLYEDVKCRS